MLIAAVLLALWTVLGTELLSALHLLSRGPVMAWWAAGAAGAAVMGALFAKRRGDWNSRGSLREDRRPIGPFALLPLCGIALVLAATFAVAVATPPNTWDTLQYHLPRVVYWLQQRHVGHFPASDLRMLEMPPLAEYFAAHLLLLSGDDRWVNLVQWTALALCAAAASLIAREVAMGAESKRSTRPLEILAALLTVTIPAAATQSVNGKNDIVVAIWLMILLWIALRAWRRREVTAPAAGLAGAALGLAILTKGTAYIYGFPLCLLLGAAMLRARGCIGSLRPGVVIVGIVLALNLPHASRNYVALGAPISVPREDGGFPIKMEDHRPRAVASNIIRNLTIHTSTPWPGVNEAQQRAVSAVHAVLGQPMNAPETTLPGSEYRIISTWHSDGNNPAPVHVLLALVLIGGVLAQPRRAWREGLAQAGAPAVAGFLLFCVLLVWQPWHARLHIPAMVLLAPSAAVMVSRWGPGARVAAGFFAFALVWPGILTNEAKPLIGPRSILRAENRELLFHQRPHEQRPIEAATAVLAAMDARTVALDLRRSPGVYSVQRTLLEALPRARVVEFRPRFGPSDPGLAIPDVVLSWRTHGRPLKIRDAIGREYGAFADLGQLILYRPAPPDPDQLAFIGWDKEEGLFPGQGQDPAALLRWGYGGRTRLWFTSRGGSSELIMDVKPGNIRNQRLTIRLNTDIIESIDLPGPGPFREIRVMLPTAPGRNTLSLEYAAGEHSGLPRERAVLFRRLQVLTGTKLAPQSPRTEQESVH